MLSWINTLPEILSTNHGQFIMDFFDWVVEPVLEFVRKSCKVCAECLFMSSRGSVVKPMSCRMVTQV